MGNQTADTDTPIYINKDRLENHLRTLATFGMNKGGGIDRSLGSKADREAREWLGQLWQEAFQTQVKIDPIANMWAGIEGEEPLPPIVLGSHHDAVKNGGRFDGALGVLMATEVIQRLKEQNHRMRHPLKIVSFSAEEPNPFNVSTLGSRTITGKLKKEDLQDVVHSETNVKLKDTIKQLGGDLEELAAAVLKPGDFRAFIECHIEQGRNLFDSGTPVGIVTKITGIYREKIRITGEANHAGTTQMKFRHDALLAASELNVAFENLILETNKKTVAGTIGYLKVFPNSANIVPGEVELIAEIRTPDSEILQQMIPLFEQSIVRIEKKRGVQMSRKVILNQESIEMDSRIQKALKEAMIFMEEPFLELPSMAGHDAVHMAGIAHTGMLFVPSIDGKSHCPEENTSMEDIVKAGNVLLKTVLILDKELDRI